MTRERPISHTIAILATGDEITQGDIINSNAQEIALRLTNQGMQIRTHISVPDNIDEIEQALQFLLNTHQAVIMTGGLGPTSDDVTRYALGKALNQPLVFDETTWERICNLLRHFGYKIFPDSNRQQALFPEGATIITNPNGTASGCMIQKNGKFIFMLPGPPNECLPMVDSTVLPTLKQAEFSRISFHKKWLLFSVSEGEIAEKLDALAKPYACVTGYRLFYPYTEFKLHSNNQSDFEILVPLIEKTIAPHIIGDGQHTASDILKEKLLTLNFTLGITDLATGGLLESTIKTWQTNSHLNFATDMPQVRIEGLAEYWQHLPQNAKTKLIITFYHNKQQHVETVIPFRGERVRKYAVEFVCKNICEQLFN